MEQVLCFLLLLSTTCYPTFARDIDSFQVISHSRIFYHETGKGRPGFVFISGLGESHETWHLVQDSIAMFGKTFSYDRAGLGQSEYHGEKKDVYNMARELHSLTSAFPKPFILVGHSLGCEIAKVYASVYPKEVCGIIFIDPGFNEEKLKASVSDSLWEERKAALKKYVPPFNAAQQAELNEANHSSAIADNITTVGSIPVILFTATHVNADFPASREEFIIKKQTHQLWLRTMPRAVHIVTDRSRHYVHEDAPDLVISAARQLRSEVLKRLKREKNKKVG